MKREKNMIPEEVFDHLKYATGARPGAWLKKNGIEYGIIAILGKFEIKKYKGTKVQKIQLREIPAASLDEWDIFFTHEC